MEQKPVNTPVQARVDVTKKDRFSKLKAYLRKKPTRKHLALVGGISAFVLFVGTAAAFTLIQNPVELQPEPVVETTYVPPPDPVYSPLTGVEVTEEQANRPVTAVMIENSIDARPQSGLQEAGIVFEAIAEGGITRFMAIYQEARPGNIGPIRSARPYYVEWAKGFDASYVHVGGSPEGLALIRALGVRDLDQSTYGDRIASRVSNRYAPHNMYTNMDKIDALNNELGFTSVNLTPFARKEITPVDPAVPLTATTIAFNISGANYNTSYTFDSATNTYPRVMASRPHTDQESGKQINPSVVIGLVTDYGINSNRIHSVYRTTGTGELFVFQDGQVIKGTWKKESQSSPLLFLDAAGAPLALNPGQKWITAIPAGRITYTP
jgi:hypothetical protein